MVLILFPRNVVNPFSLQNYLVGYNIIYELMIRLSLKRIIAS